MCESIVLERKQREFRAGTEGRQNREVTTRRRRIEEERRMRGDECWEVKSVRAEKQMRKRAG